MIPARWWTPFASLGTAPAVEEGVVQVAEAPEGPFLAAWAGYALVVVVLAGAWLARRRSRERRRRLVEHALGCVERGDMEELDTLLRGRDFRRRVGSLSGALRGLRDLLADKDAQADRLQAELERARRRFEELPQAIWLLDEEGRLEASTNRLFEILGRSEEELVGKPLSNVLPGCQGRESPRSIQVKDAFGTTKEALLLSRQIDDPDSGTTGEVGLLIEDGLADVLEGSPGDEFQDSCAKHAMDAMGDLAGGIANDFNDQLTAILGHSYMLLASLDDDSPQRVSAEEISDAAEQARLLTQQLLAFSRRQVARPVSLDLSILFEEMEEELGFLLTDGVELSIELEPDCPRLRVDRVQFYAVLKNLVRNAREAMRGKGTFRVQASRTSCLPQDVRGPADEDLPGRDWVRLRLVDSGPGMSPAILAKAFEPYFTTHEVQGRRGMGLATVYGIVTQNHGRIAVANARDRGFGRSGLVVEIFLPAAASPDRVEVSDRTKVAEPGARKRICVVEDDSQVRRLVSVILRREGHEVLTAENGQEALRLCEGLQGAVDLVLTDINMPFVGGFELAEELKERFPNTKTLFMSGFLENEHSNWDSHSPDDLLQKPFTPNDLLEHVRRGLAKDPDEAGSGTPQVMVIDDEETIRDLMKVLIEGLGYHCHVASSGDEALARLKTTNVEVVISDLVMPGPDGIETCKAIKQAFPGTKIIAMSGKVGGMATRAAAGRMGAVATLTKPFSRDELLLALEKARE